MRKKEIPESKIVTVLLGREQYDYLKNIAFVWNVSKSKALRIIINEGIKSYNPKIDIQ